eukprot:1143739-Pelagomonas_calceolata.AAC.5
MLFGTGAPLTENRVAFSRGKAELKLENGVNGSYFPSGCILHGCQGVQTIGTDIIPRGCESCLAWVLDTYVHSRKC